jgi:hypothetical protein
MAALVVLGLAGAGCYSYQPIDGPVPVGDQLLRIRLTGAGHDDMLEKNGLDMESFEGHVLDEDGSSLTVEARVPANLLAFGDQEFTDTLKIARSGVRTVEAKQFSSGRTVAGVAAGVATLGGIYAIVKVSTSENKQGGGGGNTEFSLIPVITTVLGWLR